jgi:hypothetical protein
VCLISFFQRSPSHLILSDGGIDWRRRLSLAEDDGEWAPSHYIYNVFSRASRRREEIRVPGTDQSVVCGQIARARGCGGRRRRMQVTIPAEIIEQFARSILPRRPPFMPDELFITPRQQQQQQQQLMPATDDSDCSRRQRRGCGRAPSPSAADSSPGETMQSWR